MAKPMKSKITVLLDGAEFGRFDAYCAKNGFKKSTLISRLIREHLDAAGFWQQEDLPYDASTYESARTPGKAKRN
jgi:hypothetical protein